MPYVLVGLLALVELYAGRVRRSDVPRRIDWSFAPLILLIGAGYWLAFYMVGMGWAGPLLGGWATWAGAVVFLAGAALRVWSVATLGRYFTYVVLVSVDQPVVEDGPYRLIRHPSYTGALLMGAGIGLSTRWAWPAPVIVAINLIAYLIRIFSEERALMAAIGEPYRAYMARTRRLVPFLW
jgi:protein-S-isoprenylcysteine O-methyltransferase Ste14